MATKPNRNWKKKKDYESMRKLNVLQWTWEFLRRNSEYQQDWENVVKKFPEVVHDFLLGPSAEKWGLKGYFDPYKDHLPHFIWLGEVKFSGRRNDSNTCVLQGPPNDQEGHVVWSFDLHQPIIPQLKLAKKFLLINQKSLLDKGAMIRTNFKPQFHQWIKLIRLLDAISSGAKDKEIADELFPPKCPVDKKATKCPLAEATDKHLLDDEPASKCPLGEGGPGKCALEDSDAGIKKVYDTKQQALKYVNGDYRLIPYSGI